MIKSILCRLVNKGRRRDSWCWTSIKGMMARRRYLERRVMIRKNRVMDTKTQLVAEYMRNEDLDAKEVGKHLVKYIYAKKERWYSKKECYS